MLCGHLWTHCIFHVGLKVLEYGECVRSTIPSLMPFLYWCRVQDSLAVYFQHRELRAWYNLTTTVKLGWWMGVECLSKITEKGRPACLPPKLGVCLLEFMWTA